MSSSVKGGRTMKHPIIVMTGATSGIGQIAAIDLAKLGATLVLTARSKERAEETERLISESSPNTKVDFYFGDLSVMEDVQRIGIDIKNNYPQIDVLVHNAGLHAFKQRITTDGFPEMMAVNYFTPWLLTNILLESLRNAQHAKIISIASEASRNYGKMKLPFDLTNTASFTARESSQIYGKTKLLNIMFTAELARQLTEPNIITNAVNPGFNNTGLGRELKIAPVLGRIFKLLNIGDPRRGAEIIVRLITNSHYEKVTGKYFNVGTGNVIDPASPGKDRDLQQQLWKDTEKILKKYVD